MPTSRHVPGSERDASGGTDLRLVPPALLAWAGAWLGTLGESVRALPFAVVGLVALVVLVVAVRGRRWSWGPSGVALLGGLLVGTLHALPVTTGPLRELAVDRARVEAEIVLLHDPVTVAGYGPSDGADGRQGRLWVRGRAERVTTEGTLLRVRSQVLVTVTPDDAAGWQEIGAGTRVRVLGTLGAPERGSDLGAMLRAKGQPNVIGDPRWDQRAVEATHQGLRDAVAERAPPARALVPALVVGDTSKVDAAMEESFRAAGLLHVMAVSGSNLTLLLAFLLTTAKLLGIRGRLLHAVTASGVLVFVVLCRTEPSVVRAAAMGVVALSALMAGASDGPRRGMRSLAVAVIVLLMIDPWLSRSAGFVLSTSATAGIVLWATRWSEAMARWAPNWLAQAVCVPLAAQLATGPTSVALSGDVSAVGLLANMAVGPLVGPATVFGFAAAGLGLVWPAGAELVAWPAAQAARGIVAIAEVSAAAPGATVWWPPGAAGVVLLAAATGVGLIVVPATLARRWLSLALGLLMLLLVLRGPAQPGWPPRAWDLAVCDVGQGNAIVLAAGPGSGVLVDTGGEPDAVLRCLRGLGIGRIPLLVLSHLHADHAAALPEVLLHLPVDAVMTAPGQHPDTRGRPRLTSTQGDIVRVGAVTWETLAPRPGAPPAVDESDENNGSLVGRATVGGTTVLLPGDLQADGQDRLLRSGAPVAATFLVVPHHGSRDQSEAFLRATGARMALVSVGRDNTYGHPHGRTLDTLTRLGMAVVRTDKRGDIVVRCAEERCRTVGAH